MYIFEVLNTKTNEIIYLYGYSNKDALKRAKIEDASHLKFLSYEYID